MERVMNEQLLYHAALYCRLSKDDEQDGESVSIETQKLLLKGFCQEQGYAVYQIYVDDGYSGLNFNRPAFRQMLSDIDAGKVNLVITKDLSRLGRDYVQTGYFMDIYFSRKKVRYIAVNDGIDTERMDNDIAPFKNVLNDMYARDLSRKVKSAKRQRACKGYYISAQPPYGYQVDPADRNHLIIDEEAAEVVKKIFCLCLAGNGFVKIARTLEEEQILTPGSYKLRNGDLRFARYEDGRKSPYHWSNQTVRTILADQVYTGDMVNHKTETINYKTREKVRTSKKEYIIVSGCHEPIISREDYERVQLLVKGRYRPKKHDFGNVFQNLVICAECGGRLTSMVKMNKGSKTIFLRCAHHFNYPERCRHNHAVKYDELYAIVQERLRRLIRKMDEGKLLEQLQKQSKEPPESKERKKEKRKIEKRLPVLKKIVRKLYEDYAGELLDEVNYQSLLSEYMQEQQKLMERLKEIEADENCVRDDAQNVEKLKEVLDKFRNVDVLTANMLNQLIERIEVDHAVKVDGEKKQDITIVYRFIGVVEE